jgi:hypothetical protein
VLWHEFPLIQISHDRERKIISQGEGGLSWRVGWRPNLIQWLRVLRGVPWRPLRLKAFGKRREKSKAFNRKERKERPQSAQRKPH